MTVAVRRDLDADTLRSAVVHLLDAAAAAGAPRPSYRSVLADLGLDVSTSPASLRRIYFDVVSGRLA